jgi:hypothetical protein
VDRAERRPAETPGRASGRVPAGTSAGARQLPRAFRPARGGIATSIERVERDSAIAGAFAVLSFVALQYVSPGEDVFGVIVLLALAFSSGSGVGGGGDGGSCGGGCGGGGCGGG